jgi:hypothetical protein
MANAVLAETDSTGQSGSVFVAIYQGRSDLFLILVHLADQLPGFPKIAP